MIRRVEKIEILENLTSMALGEAPLKLQLSQIYRKISAISLSKLSFHTTLNNMVASINTYLFLRRRRIHSVPTESKGIHKASGDLGYR